MGLGEGQRNGGLRRWERLMNSLVWKSCFFRKQSLDSRGGFFWWQKQWPLICDHDGSVEPLWGWQTFFSLNPRAKTCTWSWRMTCSAWSTPWTAQCCTHSPSWASVCGAWAATMAGESLGWHSPSSLLPRCPVLALPEVRSLNTSLNVKLDRKLCLEMWQMTSHLYFPAPSTLPGFSTSTFY